MGRNFNGPARPKKIKILQNEGQIWNQRNKIHRICPWEQDFGTKSSKPVTLTCVQPDRALKYPTVLSSYMVDVRQMCGYSRIRPAVPAMPCQSCSVVLKLYVYTANVSLLKWPGYIGTPLRTHRLSPFVRVYRPVVRPWAPDILLISNILTLTYKSSKPMIDSRRHPLRNF